VAHLFAVVEAGAVDPLLLHYARYTERICWLAFCLVWGVSRMSANWPVKRSQSFGSRALQIPFYVLGLLLLFFSKLIPIPALDFRILPRSDSLTVVAALLTVVGIAIAISARVSLGGNWSARVTLKEGHELIESGLYRYVRHPIYTGMLTAFLGTALLRCSPRALSGVLVFLVLFIWKIRLEERFLTAEFGDKYADYRRRVKALMPGIV
jgi:protein-S-isoprenylcysteine O-methyltransferase Ste14